jgi:arylsulfatase A-like enzyme
MRETSRRTFLQGSAALAAGAALGDPDAFARRRDRPNVLLVIVDSLRADAVFERRIHTPNIDALARQGLSFTHAFPEAMPTVPARNSILSGRRTFPFRGWHDHRGLIAAPGWSPLRNVEEALPAVLRRAGYWTAYVTDNPFLGFSLPYAPLRGSVHRFVRTGGQIGGSRPMSSVPRGILRHWLHPVLRGDPRARRRVGLYLANSRPWEGDGRSYAARVFGDALRMLDVAALHRPFALIVDTYEPHEPWTPPKQFLDLYGKRWRGPEPGMLRYGRVSGWLERHQRGPVLGRLRDLYAAEVTMTDLWLGRLLERLDRLNLERETVIMLVSDHGILLGDHGWTGKVQTALYPELIRVPFILVHPGRRKAGHTTDYFASTHDVAPTLLSMADVRAPEAMTGVDLSQPFHGRRPPERHYAWGGYSDSFFIRTRRWALWGYNKPGNFKLFNLRRDPGHVHNVAHRRGDIVRHLHGKLLARVGGRLPWYGGR